MGDYGGLGDAVKGLYYFMVTLLCIFVPLGIWKLVEIGIWCWHHIHVGIQ